MNDIQRLFQDIINLNLNPKHTLNETKKTQNENLNPTYIRQPQHRNPTIPNFFRYSFSVNLFFLSESISHKHEHFKAIFLRGAI